MVNNIKKLNYLLLYFFPFSIVIGELAINLSITLSIVLFLCLCAIEKKFFYFKERYFLFFMIFLSFGLIGSFFSQYFYNSLINVVLFFRFPLFSLSVFYLLNNNPNIIKHYFLSFFVLVCVLFIDSFYQNIHPNKINILGLEMLDKDRISSFFGKDYVLGSFLSKSIVIIFLFINLFIEKTKKIYLIILLLLVNYVIFLSGDRGALIISLIYQFLLFLIYKDIRKLLIYVYLIISIIILVHTSFFNNSYSRYYSTTKEQISNFENTNYDDMFYMSLKIFENNILFGSGIKSYRYACKLHADNENLKHLKDGCSTHPHQTYLQLLAEMGMSGLILFSLFWLNIIRQTISGIFSKNNGLVISGLFICLIYLPIIPSGNFFGTWNNSIIFLNFGFFLYYKNNKL